MGFLLTTAVIGGAAAAAGSSGTDWGGLAALLGGAAAVISALTGLVVALRRQGTHIVVVSPEQLEDIETTGELPAKAKVKKRR